MTTTCLIANPELVVNQEEDGALLFDPERGQVQVLNPTAAFLFGLLDGRRTTGDLVNCLVQEFELDDRRAAERDVEEFLAFLKGRGLAGHGA
jgi:hypothetical protein